MMRDKKFFLGFALLVFSSAVSAQETCKGVLNIGSNPFLQSSNLDFQVPNYSDYKLADILPAYRVKVAAVKEQIRGIALAQKLPNFENTILAIETALKDLEVLDSYISALSSLSLDDEVAEIVRFKAEIVTSMEQQIYTNKALFDKVAFVYERPGLEEDQKSLTSIIYNRFIDAGINLIDQVGGVEKINRLSEIKKEISQLSVDYSQAMNQALMSLAFKIDKVEDLEGIPEEDVLKAKENAESEGQWLFLNRDGSALNIMSKAVHSHVRERYLKESFPSENSENVRIAKKIANLRHELARIMGFADYAEWSISSLMADSPKVVKDLVDDLVELARGPYQEASAELKTFYQEQTGSELEMPLWDVSYYSGEFQETKTAFDYETLKEYFPMEQTFNRTLEHFERTYGLKFVLRKDIPVMHSDTRVYQAIDVASNSTLGIVYFDLFAREGKKAGAHFSPLRARETHGDNIVPALGRVTLNLIKGRNEGAVSNTEEEGVELMAYSEVKTLFHEMGHLMEALLFNSDLPSLYQLVWDAIETPSTIEELFLADPRILNTIAGHYQNGKPLPVEVIDELQELKAEGLALSIMASAAEIQLDLKWNSAQGVNVGNVREFEEEIISNIFPYRIPDDFLLTGVFSHPFVGAYPARHYSYLWSKIMASQIYAPISAHEPYSPEYNVAVKNYVDKFLSRGKTRSALASFIDLVGEEPSPDLFVERLKHAKPN